MSIHQLIARSGAENYERIRRGFIERPEERNANRLAEISLQTKQIDLKQKEDEYQKFLMGYEGMSKEEKDDTDWMIKHNVNAANGISSLPPEEQPSAWQRTVESFRQNGIPSILGEQFDPNQLQTVQMYGQKFGEDKLKTQAEIDQEIDITQKKRELSPKEMAQKKELKVAGTEVGAATLTKKTKGDTENKIFNAHEALARLAVIRDKFDPKFLQLPEKVKSAFLEGKEKLGFKLDKDEIKLVEEMAKFKRSAVSNLNSYIKQITGAQMSEDEVVRLRLAIPDPGVGLFDGDSPTEFKSKLDDIYEELVASEKRLQYLRENGFTGKITEDIANSYELSEFRDAQKSKEAGEIPTPQTDAEFEILESGDMYIDPDDGFQYRKP